MPSPRATPRLLALLAATLLLAACVRADAPLPWARWLATPTPSAPASMGAPAVAAPAAADALTLVTWNLGMGDADADLLAAQIAAFEGVELWTLQEVQPKRAARLQQAAAAGEGAAFARVLGASGGEIRLLTLYNADRFTLLDSYEIEAINTTGNARAPLVLHLRDNQTSAEFLLVNNHLYRTRDAERHQQARLLNGWAATQTLPLLTAGDFNFDWDVRYGTRADQRDSGYDAMTAADRWTWVRPDPLVPTECTDVWPCTYDDVLDFVFAGQGAQAWRAAAEVIVRPNDFPDDTAKSDHRPVMATFWVE